MQHEPDLFGSYCVQATSELARIVAAPRRVYTPEQLQTLAEQYTVWLRTPGGTWALHPHQALALAELRAYGGTFAQILAGGGKTLLGFLAPVAVSAHRPVLLLPAALIEKTQREARELAEQFRVATWLRPVSYESIGRDADKGTLERLNPDLLIADECHYLSNPKAGVTRKVLRFLKARAHAGDPVRFVAMSGTMTNHSILAYAHLAEHTTPAPLQWLPRDNAERWEWHKALDKAEMGVGALRALGGNGSLESTRIAYRERMLSTPTVVTTTEGETGSSLEISERSYGEKCPEIDRAFAQLREAWDLPDGWRLEDGPRVWAAAVELALGFYMAWEPRAPSLWAERRKAWASACREILTGNRRGIDTEGEVKASIDAGNESPLARAVLSEWREIEPTFTPVSVCRWISRAPLEAIAKQVSKSPSPVLIWTHRTEFGAELSRFLGVPYFGELGLSADGVPIEKHRGHAVLSTLANRAGRNLQPWHRSIVTMPAMQGRHLEQLCARTHRRGQPADRVFVDLNVSCVEHADGIDRAIDHARYAQATFGQPMRLCYADVLRPISSRRGLGPRWEKRG